MLPCVTCGAQAPRTRPLKRPALQRQQDRRKSSLFIKPSSQTLLAGLVTGGLRQTAAVSRQIVLLPPSPRAEMSPLYEICQDDRFPQISRIGASWDQAVVKKGHSEGWDRQPLPAMRSDCVPMTVAIREDAKASRRLKETQNAPIGCRNDPQPSTSTNHKRWSAWWSPESRNQRRGGTWSHLLTARSFGAVGRDGTTYARATNRLAHDRSCRPTGTAIRTTALWGSGPAKPYYSREPQARLDRTGLGE